MNKSQAPAGQKEAQPKKKKSSKAEIGFERLNLGANGSTAAGAANRAQKRRKTKSNAKDANFRLPVSLLCGFLGSGKTTLLKHILETKHAEEGDFKCAVIVNDMAELNIDKSLIDRSSLVQSDEVIAMQNGCVCCTLKSDLVDQIIEIANKRNFDYMIIEASGVSEPSEIASLFAECKDDHNHEKEHTKQTLFDVARLDTCVTVVDSAEFHDNFETVKEAPRKEGQKEETVSQLLAEQMEFSNVIILNKTDLVDKSQLESIQEQAAILNPKAKILVAKNSRINVMEVVGTNLFNASDFDLSPTDIALENKEPSCCAAKRAGGESPCCKRARTMDSGLSQVLLANKQTLTTRHQTRFGISSFVYRARRPFHPQRFHESFVEEFFVMVSHDDLNEEDGESETDMEQDAEGELKATEEKQEELKETVKRLRAKYKAMKQKRAEPAGPKKAAADKKEEEEDSSEGDEVDEESVGDDEMEEGDADEDEESLEKKQAKAQEKQAWRYEKLGMLLRCKGFIWMANMHDLMGCVGQAGNMITLHSPGLWTALDRKAYEGSEAEKAELRKEWQGEWGDRRQDLVFIGKDLKHSQVQKLLDGCLLTDEEMALGVDGWKAIFGDEVLEA